MKRMGGKQKTAPISTVFTAVFFPKQNIFKMFKRHCYYIEMKDSFHMCIKTYKVFISQQVFKSLWKLRSPPLQKQADMLIKTSKNTE